MAVFTNSVVAKVPTSDKSVEAIEISVDPLKGFPAIFRAVLSALDVFALPSNSFALENNLLSSSDLTSTPSTTRFFTFNLPSIYILCRIKKIIVT